MISAIVTRGFGNFSTVNFVPTRGFLSGGIPPINFEEGAFPEWRGKDPGVEWRSKRTINSQ